MMWQSVMQQDSLGQPALASSPLISNATRPAVADVHDVVAAWVPPGVNYLYKLASGQEHTDPLPMPPFLTQANRCAWSCSCQLGAWGL